MPSEREHEAIPASAFGVLRAYLEARAAFSAGDFEIVRSAFLFKRLPAGEFLQRGGDISRYAALVAIGCLRSYFMPWDPGLKPAYVTVLGTRLRYVKAGSGPVLVLVHTSGAFGAGRSASTANETSHTTPGDARATIKKAI